MIQWDHGAVSLKHRPWNITAPTPNAIATYLCWAQFSLRFWHFWWVSSLFQWLPTISKPVLSISLIVGRLYIRISLTTRENTLVARDGEGFMEVAMLLHVLMFWPGDYLRGRRVAGIGQRKITQCAHRELWERPVLPGAAYRRNWCMSDMETRSRRITPCQCSLLRLLLRPPGPQSVIKGLPQHPRHRITDFSLSDVVTNIAIDFITVVTI